MKNIWKNKITRIALTATLACLFLFMLLDLVVFPLPKDKLIRSKAHFVYDRNGNLLNCFASQDYFWRMPVKLEEISPELIKTVLNTEDRYFRYHPGVNIFSLITSAIENVREGRVVRGGSTITMQIARMMEPKPRNIMSKLVEIFRAAQLELHYSKNDLLEFYFNLVPYGGNIEGVGTAAYFYFGKSPQDLSASESAILAAIPSSPNNFRPDLEPEQCRKRRDQILASMYERNLLDCAEYLDARMEEIPQQRIEKPFTAPHFSQSIIAENQETSRIYSTIDYETQILCERLAENYHPVLNQTGIHNLSIVVIDNHSGELLAMVGSPDFEDVENHGQINGALAKRSPGSALKPFVYALGFEKGIITPASIVDDIPVNYAGYTPENYDEKYRGIVTIEDALIQSLNIPAVNITKRVGLDNFYSLLRSGGISSLDRQYYDYGLPLVLGACEVSLVDLSNLYACLAREGLYLPLKMIQGRAGSAKKDLLSEEACYLVSNILANLQRPYLPASWEFTRDLPTVAWKTGTSYGRKDAWAIGYNPDFTVGVWTGNFSGEGSPYLVGAESSAPLMFSIFNELTKGKELAWFDPPEVLGRRKVCTVSGMPPNQYCNSTREDFYIKGLSNNTQCDIHQPIWVDKNTGYLLCRACVHMGQPDTLVVEKWPVRLSEWLLAQGRIGILPEHNPQCTGIFADGPPQIVSPEKNSLFEIRNGIPIEYQQILFRATAGQESAKVHWFLDSRLYTSCPVGKRVFYKPEKGVHKLMCVDDLGRSNSITFEVQ